jgi:murein DD-endopeptidase MepM/ murein hydrolase activator NlpD
MKPLLILLIAGLLGCSTAAIALPKHAPVPGGIAVIELGSDKSAAPGARWGEQPLAVVRDNGRWFALLGIPLDTLPGELEISVSGASTATVKKVNVQIKNYPEQRLTIKDKRKVEPDPDDLLRIAREKAVTEAVKRQFTANPAEYGFPAAGQWPALIPLRSAPHLQRLPRNPHAGLDVAVGSGAPIKAPADGVVANTGDYFFNGNTVFVDHGQGLISAYMHMSRIDVALRSTGKKG